MQSVLKDVGWVAVFAVDEGFGLGVAVGGDGTTWAGGHCDSGCSLGRNVGAQALQASTAEGA